MSRRRGVNGRRAGKLAAAGLLLGLGAAPLAAAPPAKDFSFFEFNYVSQDVDLDERVGTSGLALRVSSDDGSGIGFAGSWQFYGRWHALYEYATTDQSLTTEGTVDGEPVRLRGDFDVDRTRVGVGYGRRFGERWLLYGRATFDATNFDDVNTGANDVSDTDDAGPGAELGGRLRFGKGLELQGHVRYTSVGDVDVTAVDEFDEDWLYGLTARWHTTRHFFLQAGFEIGQIDAWFVGGRVVP